MVLQLFFEELHHFEFQKSARNCHDQRDILYDQISIHKDLFPNWQTADVVIFGVEEYRNSEKEISISEVPNFTNSIRQELYNLSFFSKDVHIADLGNLRLGNTLEDTLQRLAEVCEILINNNTLPVIIGGNHGLDYGQFRAYQNLEKFISVLNIDAFIDLQPKGNLTPFTHIQQILLHEPNFLFDYNQLGVQQYLTTKSFSDTLQKLNFEILNVGKMRENLQETEPMIRDADMMSFDLAALKKSVVPNCGASPFGLTGEEASQICWYAGLNEKLSSVGFYGFNPALPPDGQTASVTAIMVWYFMEGFTQRKEEYSFKSNFHTKYIVGLEAFEQDLIFYKSKVSEKWWLEIGLNSEEFPNRNIVVPCSYSDYETANKGVIPDRWLKGLDKV